VNPRSQIRAGDVGRHQLLVETHNRIFDKSRIVDRLKRSLQTQACHMQQFFAEILEMTREQIAMPNDNLNSSFRSKKRIIWRPKIMRYCILHFFGVL